MSHAQDTIAISTGVHTAKMMAWWKMWCGTDVGTRRPTAYPEWATLEVLHGGFASGQALSRIQAGEQSSNAYMSAEGIAELEEMLESGKYRIDQPENGALLVFVWLLQQDRAAEAKVLFDQIAPYLDELRFYPHPTDADCYEASTTVAALANVSVMRTALADLKAKLTGGEGKRYAKQRRMSAVGDVGGYADLQADAIALLLTSVGDKDKFLSGETHDLFTLPIDADAKTALLAMAAHLDATTSKLRKHSSSRKETTRMMVEALRTDGAVVKPGRVARRIRDVVAARGLKGSDAYSRYIASVRLSTNTDATVPDKVDLVVRRAKDLPAGSYLQSGVAEMLTADVTNEDSPLIASTGRVVLPASICRIVRRSTLGTLEELITKDVINSAEMIAHVLPQLFTSAVGACIEDSVARALYAQMSIAFSRRRSVILVNLEKQVRLEELPWIVPIVSLIKTSGSRQCGVVMREAVRCYVKYFPQTITPNKLISALKDVMRKGVADDFKTNLTEELAADIFCNAFSPNFNAAGIVAAKAMQNTVYSRYFGLADIYAALASLGADGTSVQKGELFEHCVTLMSKWQQPFEKNRYSPVQGGRCIEAAMVITTHNLAQLVDVCGGATADNAIINFRVATLDTWQSLMDDFSHFTTNAIADWSHILHGQRDVSWMWRQLLFYLSMHGSAEANGKGADAVAAAQREVLAEMTDMLVKKIPKTATAYASLKVHFLLPLEEVINGSTHTIPADAKVTEGAIVLGYFGWRMFNPNAAEFAEKALRAHEAKREGAL